MEMTNEDYLEIGTLLWREYGIAVEEVSL
jgi:hypothetical protein